jgi:peptidoglycan hydrolase-like protein with peptidoglycan-binding domain
MSSRLLIPVLTGIVFLAAPASAQTASAHAASSTARSTQHHLVKTAHHGRHASLYRRAQLRLKSMGDYAGRVDGRRHASYVRALKRFQTAHHLRASGRLTPKTQRALGV